MRKGLILCSALLLVIALPLMATVHKANVGTPQRFDSEPNGASTYVPPVATSGTKAVGTADSILYQTGATDVIWRSMSGPGGRNIGEDASGNMVVYCSKASGNGTNPFIPQYCYSTDGGVTWYTINLYPPGPGSDTLRRVYGCVAVDYNGNPHFACQAAYSPYQGFMLMYIRDDAGIGGGLLTYMLLNDTTAATGTTPYNPDMVINRDSIWIFASDYSGVYGIQSADKHLLYFSPDLGQTWNAMQWSMDPTWEPSNTTYADVVGTDGPVIAVSDDGQHLVDFFLTGGCTDPVTGDTLTELPFYAYSENGGTSWTYGGAVNTADTCIPRAWVDADGVATGWWHIGSAVMDHNGIAHYIWSSNGSIKTVDNNGEPTLMYADPLVHSYNTTPYDFSSFTYEKVGNEATYDTVTGEWMGSVAFSCVSCDASNNIIFVFCDTYDLDGYVGVWAQVKGSDGLHMPLLINAIDGVNAGSWIETPQYIDGDVVHITWGRGGDTWSNVDCLMHSTVSITTLLAQPLVGVAGEPPVKPVSKFALNASRPNPVRNNAELSFNLPTAGRYSLQVFNVAGQLVRTLDGSGVAGFNQVSWNTKDNNGRSVANGVYLYKLNANNNTATRKLVVVK